MAGEDDTPVAEPGTETELGELPPMDRDKAGLDLIGAVKNSNLNGVIGLIDAQANVNVRDQLMGATALHYAAAYSFHSALVALIRCGRCDYLIRDKKGMYPSEVADVIAKDPRAANVLSEMEARQAHKTGVQAWPKVG